VKNGSADDDLIPVSSNLEAFTLPTFQDEVEVWRTRAHELWLDARTCGDLRAQAAALTVAFRGLRDWQLSLEESVRVERTAVPKGERPLTIEALDAIIREYQDGRPNYGQAGGRHTLDESVEGVNGQLD
jgi:hypothetical protein